MNKKIVLLALVSTLLLSTSFATLSTSRYSTMAGPNLVYPLNFPGQTLNQAIHDPTVQNGTTIIVEPGRYTDHLFVNRSITLWGGLGGTTILSGGGNGTVVNIVASNVVFKDFTVEQGHDGVIIQSGNNSLLNNTIQSNSNYGIDITANGPKNTLIWNTLNLNRFNLGVSGSADQFIDPSNYINGKPVWYLVNRVGANITNAGYIAIVNSKNITLNNLNLSHNGQGVLIANSTNIVLKNLNLTNNDVGLALSNVNASTIQNVTCKLSNTEGLTMVKSNSNIVRNNSMFNDQVGIALSNSNNNVIENNVIASDDYGLMLSFSQSNKIIANDISNARILNGDAFHSDFSNSNTVTENEIRNSNCGIYLFSSNFSTFYRNNIMNNSNQILSSYSLNTWDNGREGNYWRDYTGTDSNRDGIADPSPKLPWHGVDRYPLNQSWSVVKDFYAVELKGSPQKTVNVTERPIVTVSNSTRAGFWFSWTRGEMDLNITSGTSESINITISRKLLDGPYNVTVTGNGAVVVYAPKMNATHCSFYITYIAGVYRVKIVGTEIGKIPGDVTLDGKVNVLDLIYVATHLGTNQTDGGS